MARRDGKSERRHGKDGATPRPEEPSRRGPSGRGTDPEREEVEVAAADLVEALVRLDLEVALAHEAAASHCSDAELARRLRELAREHRAHAEALNEALEAEGRAPVGPPAPDRSALPALLAITGPLGDEVIVVTLLGNEQLTSLAYDAALSYEWDGESAAMLREFQEEEERHLAWLAERHDALGGDAPGAEAP
jgi:hypothetical protein